MFLFPDAYILFEGVRAKIIRADIGATNGVVHIISSVLFMPEDLNRDISGTSQTCLSLHVLLLTIIGMIICCYYC